MRQVRDLKKQRDVCGGFLTRPLASNSLFPLPRPMAFHPTAIGHFQTMTPREAWQQVKNLGALKLDIRRSCQWVRRGLDVVMKASDEQLADLRGINAEIDRLLAVIYPKQERR